MIPSLVDTSLDFGLFRVVRPYRSQMAAILQNKMAAKMWTYQLASIKILVERYLNYLCAKNSQFYPEVHTQLPKSPHYSNSSSKLLLYVIFRHFSKLPLDSCR